MTSKEFNWDRKISLKEIAQFYEDRLRELDGKFQRLSTQAEVFCENSSNLIEEVTRKADALLEERISQRISDLSKKIRDFETTIEVLTEKAKNIEIDSKRDANLSKQQMEELLRCKSVFEVQLNLFFTEFFMHIYDWNPVESEACILHFKYVKEHPDLIVDKFRYFPAISDDEKLEIVREVAAKLMLMASDLINENEKKREGL